MPKEYKFVSLKNSGLKSLYKYGRFDKDNYFENIFKNILYFPNISQLNDPFDSQIPVRYDLCTDEQIDKLTIRQIPNYDPNNFTHLMRKKIAKDEIRLNPEAVLKRISGFVEERVGIFSLAQRKDNLLLWSHYSDNHKGYCIEFDTIKLNNLLIEVFLTQNVKAFIFKVNYDDNYPIIIPTVDSDEERLRKQFLIKSKDWEYEQEWRILVLDGVRINGIPKGIIKNVYLGLNVSTTNIDLVKNLLKKYNSEVKLFKAKKAENKFALVFDKIEF